MKKDEKTPIHHPHNNLFEKAFSNPAVTWDFLQNRLEPSMLAKIDPTTLKLESGSFIDTELNKSYSDLVMSARLENKKSYIYFLIEHQTKNDKHMMLRLLEYNIKLRRRHKEQGGKKLPTIINFVLYAGKYRYTREKNILEAFEDSIAFVDQLKRNVIIDLTKEDDEAIIKDKKAALAEWVLKNASQKDFCLAIDQTAIDIAQLINGSTYWESAIYYMMDRDQHNPKNLLKKINNLDPIKEDIVMTGLQRIRNEEKQQGINLGKQEGIKLGEQRGIKLGKQEGKKEGKKEILQALIKKGIITKEQAKKLKS